MFFFSSSKENFCAGTPQTDTCIRIVNVAPTFLLLSPCSEEKPHIRFLSEKKSHENVKSLSFHLCRKHARNPTARIFRYSRISVIWPTRSCKMPILPAKSHWVTRRFSLIRSSTRPLWNSSVAVTGRQTLCLSHKSDLQHHYFTSVCTTTHSVQSIYHEQLAYIGEFRIY